MGWQHGETKDREQKDPSSCTLDVGKEGRGGGWPQPLPQAALGRPSSSTFPSAQSQHQGVTAWAQSQEPDSTTRETMELFWLETAFQGQVFSGEKKYFYF